MRERHIKSGGAFLRRRDQREALTGLKTQFLMLLTIKQMDLMLSEKKTRSPGQFLRRREYGENSRDRDTGIWQDH